MRRALLVCGVVSSLVYVTADVLGTLRWEGYSYVDQTISELAAADAPSRPVVMPLFLAYDALLLAFAAGVAGSRVRAARVTAAMLAAVALIGVAVYFFPIHTRGAAWSLNETMHSILTAVTVILLVLSMGFGALAAGPQFRNYSIATLVVTLLAGAWGGWIGRSLADNGPTPWVGIVERVSVFSYLLWVAVLAIALLPRRRQPDVLRAAA